MATFRHLHATAAAYANCHPEPGDPPSCFPDVLHAPTYVRRLERALQAVWEVYSQRQPSCGAASGSPAYDPRMHVVVGK